MTFKEGMPDYNQDMERIGYPYTKFTDREYTTRNPFIPLARLLTNLRVGVRLTEPNQVATDEFWLGHGFSGELPKVTITVTPFGERVFERIAHTPKFNAIAMAYEGHHPSSFLDFHTIDDQRFKGRVIALYFEHLSAALRAGDRDIPYSPLPHEWKDESPDEAKMTALKWLAGDKPLTAGEIQKEIEAIVREEFPEFFSSR